MNWLDKHQMKIFWFSWFFIILVCVFIFFSYPVHAETSVKKLPYDYSWNYFAIPEQILNIALNHASQYFDTSQDNVIVFWYEIGDNSWLYQFCVAQVDDITYSSGYTYDTTDLTLNQITLHFSHSAIGFTDGNSLVDPGNQSYAPTSFTFFGSSAHFVQPTGLVTQTYTHMPLYGTVVLDNKLIIGTPQDDPVIVTGHATEPINDPDNFINGIDGHPISKPTTPTITPYTPPVIQFPSIDTSTIETLLESLIDTVVYGFNYLSTVLSGYFSNLLNNLVSLFNYVVDSIGYAINKIIKSIQDLATDFYNNMVSLFEPLMANIGYLIEPLDSQEIQDTFEGTSIYGVYYDYSSFFSSFDSVITGTSEPNSLIIPIHLENISTLSEFGVTCQYLDLTQFEEIRSPLRAFCWVFCSFGAIMLVAHSLPDWLKGSSGGGSSSVSGKE